MSVATITDAETGEPIQNVLHVAIDMPPGGPFVATLDVLADIDIVAEARIKGERDRDEARRLLAAVTDAWLQLPFRPHAPQMTAPISEAVEWLRTHPAMEVVDGDDG